MAENIINRNLQNIQDPDTEMNQMIPEANNFAFDIGSRVAPLGTFFAGTDYRSSNMDKNIMDIIANQGTQKGTIGYQDYDSKQPSNTAFPDLDGMMSRYLSGEISPSQFGNATQTGRMNYNLDPNTGQYNFTGNKYDFRPDVADQGGIFGYFANKANERGMNINPGSSTKAGYLSDYEAGEHYNMTPEPADAISRTNVQGMDYEMDPGAFMNPNIQPSQNMFQRAGNFVKDLELQEYLPFIGEKSLTGMLGRGIGNLFQNIAPARYGYSQDRFNRMTPGQQAYTSGLYRPGGLLQGYNQRSAFGLGALGTLANRLDAIQNRRMPQTKTSFARQEEIKNAINQTINTGEREALADPNRSVQHPGSNIRTRTDIDVADGGAETSGGKIVCTMMNDSYGFGNFRNKIWLKHSKDLPKEYEVGYHKIFLPLVKFAKGEGKINKVVKKTLEHIARHRTLDLKQKMKGKTHTLGRVYRKILEPICFLVGKASMFVRRR